MAFKRLNNYIFRRSVFKPSSGCNSQILQYTINTVFKYGISFTKKQCQLYRGADKSLARPGRKQARKHVRDARDFNNIETRAVIIFFSCKARRRREFTPF